jgi:2-oxoglutarate ferredoxin oxidoreductase subunit beta
MTMDKNLPTPIGVLYKEEKATYEDMMAAQIDLAKEKIGKTDLQKIISGTNTWEVS